MHGNNYTKWELEDRKWQLRRVSLTTLPIHWWLDVNNAKSQKTIQDGINFMDITNHEELGIYRRAAATGTPYRYPNKPYNFKSITSLTKNMTTKGMKKELETFSDTKKFRTRFYKSNSGAASAQWLLDQVSNTVKESKASKYGASVKFFEHPWGQHSIIARIPGKTNKTVVVGAHQDSINPWGPYWFAAPGADDDGSGTVTIHETLRTLLKSEKFRRCEAENNLEFHWYSAEEGGLLGSQAIFSSYEKENHEVVAMLQQDMTGYTKGTKKTGERQVAGLITDYVDPTLTEFVKLAIDQVSNLFCSQECSMG